MESVVRKTGDLPHLSNTVSVVLWIGNVWLQISLSEAAEIYVLYTESD